MLGAPAPLVLTRSVKWDVHDGFEIDGRALPRCGPELPLAQGFHGVGIELLIETPNQLDAIH
jgi:hypothetical protein